MTDDRELLRQYAEASSEDAFTELVRRHVPLVYSAALRQVHGDEAAAKDVTQSVFVDLAKKAASLLGRPLLASWLYTSTRFAASKVLRSEQRRLLRERAVAAMQEPAIQTGPERTWAELSPMLDEAMALLEVADRDAVLLRYFEGKQLKAVGAALGLSEDAARMRVNRALETLRSQFERRGVMLPAAALSTALSCEAVKAAPAGLASSISGTALAGAATGLGVLAVMIRALMASKLKVGVVGAVLAAAVTVPVVLHQQDRPEPPPQAVPPYQPLKAGNDGSPNPDETVPGEEAPAPGPGMPGGPVPGRPFGVPRLPSRPGGILEPAVSRRSRSPSGGQSVPLPSLPLAPLAARPLRPSQEAKYDEARQRMVAEQLVARGMAHQPVLQAMGTVTRHQFVPARELRYAYADQRFPPGLETPYVVASVAERIEPKATDRVLEINSGSGYQAAVLGELVQAVYTVESDKEWAESNLQRLGYTNNIFVRHGELERGWPEAALFDAIVVNGSADQITPSLVEQLKAGGRLIIPVGEDNNLHVYLKSGGRLVGFANWPVRPTPVPGNEIDLPPVREMMRITPK
jgi:protein-L-isoaspartate(D-aspartate) O-methyltransferase